MGELITTTEAAQRIGVVDGSVIRHAIHTGTLKATKRGRDWWIDTDDFRAWLDNKIHGKKEEITPRK